MVKPVHQVFSNTKEFRHRIVCGGICGSFAAYKQPATLQLHDCILVAVTYGSKSFPFVDPSKIYIVKEYES